MNCCSRSTLGIIIGALNIFVFGVFIIYIIALLTEIDDLPEEKVLEYDEILSKSVAVLYVLLIFCIVSLLTSSFLILGIIKERHTLMKPWIVSAIIGIIFYMVRLLIVLVAAFTKGMSFGTILSALFMGLLTIGLQLLIFYPIYTLYTDLRDASEALEHRGLNNKAPLNPPTYGDLEKGGEMYN